MEYLNSSNVTSLIILSQLKLLGFLLYSLVNFINSYSSYYLSLSLKFDMKWIEAAMKNVILNEQRVCMHRAIAIASLLH